MDVSGWEVDILFGNFARTFGKGGRVGWRTGDILMVRRVLRVIVV